MSRTTPPHSIPPRGLFVTGADTGVGKTEVACAIARELTARGIRVGVYKPVASGVAVANAASRTAETADDDASRLWRAAGQPGTLEQVCPQVFAAPLAPHLAARAEGRAVDPVQLRRGLEIWSGQCDLALVEGAGGLMSPISGEDYVADLALDFGYPLIVVVANRIGCVNQTLQTLITASVVGGGERGAEDSLSVAGVVLCNTADPDQHDDPSRESNGDELAARCISPLLGELDWRASLIRPRGKQPINWLQLARGE